MMPRIEQLAQDKKAKIKICNVPRKAKNLHKSYINIDIKIMNKNGNESLETW